jgi:hypothetical protein
MAATACPAKLIAPMGRSYTFVIARTCALQERRKSRPAAGLRAPGRDSRCSHRLDSPP